MIMQPLDGASLLDTEIFALLLSVVSRLYPVGITVQRHLTKDITLHNYHIPSGVRHPPVMS